MTDQDIQGTVTDSNGDPVSGAIVELTRSYQSDPRYSEVVRRTTTDDNGNYAFYSHPDGDGTTNQWHVSAYSHDGSSYLNSFNNPGVTADLSAIPDSGIYLYAQQRNQGIRVWDTSDTGFFQSSDESYLSSSYGGAQEGSAISLNSDGTRVYYSDGDTLFQESLSTPFDLRTNNGVEATLDVNVGSEPSYGFGITWYDGGSKAYVSTGERTSDGEQLLYTFSTRYNLDTATYQRSDFVPSGSQGSSSVDFNENGTKGYNGSRGQSTIYQYDLTTPFDLSTRTNTESTNIREDPIALRFEPSGEYLYTGHHSPDEVNRYKCSTNFDLTTVGSETTLRSNNNGDAYNGMFISGPAYY